MMALIFTLRRQQQIEIDAAQANLLPVAQPFNPENPDIGAIEGYHRHMAAEPLRLPPGAQPKRRRETDYARMKTEGRPGHLEGDVRGAGVSVAGDLGWSWGQLIFAVPDSAGHPAVTLRKYLCTRVKIDRQRRMTRNIRNRNPQPDR